MNKLITLLILALIVINVGNSQTKSPEEFLGYKLGDQFTRHHQVVNYFNYIADNNTNVKFIKYGDTYEKRPLHVAIIASPENFSKLEEIRKDHLKAAGLIKGEANDNGIAIVWLSYNVHGNE